MQAIVFLSIVALILIFCFYSLNYQKKKQQSLQRLIKELEESDRELAELEYQDRLENLAQDIRTVVLCTMDLVKEPYPYRIKKNVPFVKKAHKNVLSAFSTPSYKKAVELASHDRDITSQDEYKSFFIQYTSTPLSYSLNIIKEAIPQKYLDDLECDLFVLWQTKCESKFHVKSRKAL